MFPLDLSYKKCLIKQLILQENLVKNGKINTYIIHTYSLILSALHILYNI